MTDVPGKDKDKEVSLVETYNAEINRELARADVVRALLATTFKKFTPELMKQALLEGMLRGFSFKNFLMKDIYALKYGEGYSLITSIDFARKRGQRSGVTGVSKPTYTEKNGVARTERDHKRIETCSITVFTKGGHPGGYTATPYFDEYYKEGKTWPDTGYAPSMWDLKPRTMIAKVAEMHALRKACPEEFSQLYIQEEFDAGNISESRIEGAMDLVEKSGLQMKHLKEDTHYEHDDSQETR